MILLWLYQEASKKGILETAYAGFFVDLFTPNFIQQVFLVLIGLGAKAFFDKALKDKDKSK